MSEIFLKKFKLGGKVGEDVAVVSRFEKEESEMLDFLAASQAEGWMESSRDEWEVQLKNAESGLVTPAEVVAPSEQA